MAAASRRTRSIFAARYGRKSGPLDKRSRPRDKPASDASGSVRRMFGLTLLDTILGGDALDLFGGVELAPAAEEDEELESELVLPDYAESRQAHRRIYG